MQLLDATQQALNTTREVVKGFNRIDTNYIEPQHYEFTVMGQITHNYDFYRLSSAGPHRQSVTLAPDVNTKIGPYVGWRWLFLGYTFQIGAGAFDFKKHEVDLSIYSSQVGVDIFWRESGENYKIRSLNMGNGIDTRAIDGMNYDGITSSITGIQAYYIFNHKRFSYPAAFSQSTIQKRSCGSWMAGAGYTSNTLAIDMDKLRQMVQRYMGPDVQTDTTIHTENIRYHDISLSAGYGYNWVPRRHWLVAASLSVALAYKTSSSNSRPRSQTFLGTGFDYKDLNIDGVMRFGVVYNNMRWYAGLSIIAHTNNYHQEQFSAYNVFGSVNVYAGLNFGKKKRYRNIIH
ncbi:MAG: DUF4421 domain-containing protein [Prevotella sp.]|nr:DUF4421 domain-containing protein [Prevotella sp.]